MNAMRKEEEKEEAGNNTAEMINNSNNEEVEREEEEEDERKNNNDNPPNPLPSSSYYDEKESANNESPVENGEHEVRHDNNNGGEKGDLLLMLLLSPAEVISSLVTIVEPHCIRTNRCNNTSSHAFSPSTSAMAAQRALIYGSGIDRKAVESLHYRLANAGVMSSADVALACRNERAADLGGVIRTMLKQKSILSKQEREHLIRYLGEDTKDWQAFEILSQSTKRALADIIWLACQSKMQDDFTRKSIASSLSTLIFSEKDQQEFAADRASYRLLFEIDIDTISPHRRPLPLIAKVKKEIATKRTTSADTKGFFGDFFGNFGSVCGCCSRTSARTLDDDL